MSAPLEKTKHPGIYKRGSRYVTSYRDAAGKQRWRSASTIAEALRIRSDEIGKRDRGERDSSDPKREFTDYAREWIVSFTGRTTGGISRETRQDYARALGLTIELDEAGKVVSVGEDVVDGGACDWFGRTRLASIGPKMLAEYAGYVAAGGRNGRKRNSVRLALAPIRAMLGTAHEHEVIVSNPMLGLRNLLPVDEESGEDEHVKSLDPVELRALLDATPDGWRFFFEFLAETGLRIGEQAELRWGDLEIGTEDAPALHPRLHVRRRFYRGRVARPKGGKTRTLKLTRAMAEALRDRRGDAGDDDLVFPTERGCRINGSTLMGRVLKPAAVAVGLGEMVESPKSKGAMRAASWVGFHTFRHTCATALIVEEKWRLEQVQVYLGHKDIATTRRYYVHLFGDDLPDRRSVLDPERTTSVLDERDSFDRTTSLHG
jgi:integrase